MKKLGIGYEDYRDFIDEDRYYGQCGALTPIYTNL